MMCSLGLVEGQEHSGTDEVRLCGLIAVGLWAGTPVWWWHNIVRHVHVLLYDLSCPFQPCAVCGWGVLQVADREDLQWAVYLCTVWVITTTHTYVLSSRWHRK